MRSRYTIPLRSDAPWFEQSVNIGDDSYSLTFYFNVRANRWFLDVTDIQDSPIVQGLCLQIDRDLARHVTYKLLSQTILYCQDDGNLGREPGLVSFLATHSFGFVSET